MLVQDLLFSGDNGACFKVMVHESKVAMASYDQQNNIGNVLSHPATLISLLQMYV